MTFLAVSVFRKCITLLNIHVNLKLGLLENYDTKPLKKEPHARTERMR